MAMPAKFDGERGGEVVAGSVSHWWKQFDDPLLDALLEEALVANYSLRIALEKIEQTRAQYRIERSHLWPEIDLNATAIRTGFSKNLFPPPPTPSTPTIPGGPATGSGTSVFPRFLNIFQVGFDAIWEIDFFGKFRHGKKAARHLWKATKEDYRSAMISMLGEVAVSYIGIRALQKKIELTRGRILAGEEELQIASSLFQTGLNNEIQVQDLVSTLESDRASLPVLITSFKQSVYSLAYLLGRQPEGLIELFQEIRPIPQASGRVPVGLPSDLLRRRPDVRSAERQLAAATEQTGAAVADLFPHIALTGISFGGDNRVGSTVGFESDRLNKLFEGPSRMFSVGVGINWDLLDFGRVRGQVDVKKSLQRQALLTYEQTVIASLKDVESALVAWFEEQERKAALQKKVDAARHILEMMEGLYLTGLTTQTEVLQARKSLIDAENLSVESQQALSSDLVAIYKAIGGDWISD
jgi:NodT family efflux transporter outer membrane factor (OMF) lipoprotein